MRDLGGEIVLSPALNAQSVANAAAASGSAVDRKGYDGAVILCTVGATGGAATSMSMAFKVEEGNNDGEWAAISGKTATLTAKDSSSEINIDLSGVKRYVRVVVTGTLTGGTAPTGYCGAVVALGQSRNLPV